MGLFQHPGSLRMSPNVPMSHPARSRATTDSVRTRKCPALGGTLMMRVLLSIRIGRFRRASRRRAVEVLDRLARLRGRGEARAIVPAVAGEPVVDVTGVPNFSPDPAFGPEDPPCQHR